MYAQVDSIDSTITIVDSSQTIRSTITIVDSSQTIRSTITIVEQEPPTSDDGSDGIVENNGNEAKSSDRSRGGGGSGRTNVDVSQFLQGPQVKSVEQKYPKWFYQVEEWYIDNKITRTDYHNLKAYLDGHVLKAMES